MCMVERGDTNYRCYTETDQKLHRGRPADLLLNWSLFGRFREEVLTFTFAGPETQYNPEIGSAGLQADRRVRVGCINPHAIHFLSRETHLPMNQKYVFSDQCIVFPNKKTHLKIHIRRFFGGMENKVPLGLGSLSFENLTKVSSTVGLACRAHRTFYDHQPGAQKPGQYPQLTNKFLIARWTCLPLSTQLTWFFSFSVNREKTFWPR